MVAEERLSLEKSLWFANQSRVKSLFCEAPLFPARGTRHKLLDKVNHDDHMRRRGLMMMILMSKRRSPDQAEYHADLVADHIWYYLVILASIIKQIVIKS